MAEIDALKNAGPAPATVAVAVAVDSKALKQLVLVERAGGLTMPEAKIAALRSCFYGAGMQAPQPSHLPAAPHEKLVELTDGLAATLEP